MSDLALWVHRGKVDPHWQLGDLGAVAGPQALLLGWDALESLDGGVPPEVVGIMSRALAATARVTYLCSEPLTPTSTDWLESRNGEKDFTRTQTTPSRLSRGLGRLRGTRGAVALVCSNGSATIARAFADSEFAWWLQSQVLLLSAPEAAPPAVSPDTVLTLLADDWATRATALRRQGIVAVARPAVDGDAIGMLALDEATAERFLTAIESESGIAALGWSVRG